MLFSQKCVASMDDGEQGQDAFPRCAAVRPSLFLPLSRSLSLSLSLSFELSLSLSLSLSKFFYLCLRRPRSGGGAATFAGGWPDQLPAKDFCIFPPKPPFWLTSPPPPGCLAMDAPLYVSLSLSLSFSRFLSLYLSAFLSLPLSLPMFIFLALCVSLSLSLSLSLTHTLFT